MVCKRGTTGREGGEKGTQVGLPPVCNSQQQLTGRLQASKGFTHAIIIWQLANPLQSLQPLSSFFPLLEWQTQRGDAPGPSQAQAAEPHHHIARVWPRQATTDSPILHIAGKFSICTRWQTEPAHRRHWSAICTRWHKPALQDHCQPSAPDGTNLLTASHVTHLHQMANRTSIP